MSTFWSIWIIVVTAGMMVGCLWLLFANARGVPGEVKDHTWDDDLHEYNNPLPRWWLNLFILTIIFAAGYLAFYPGLGNLGGRLGWTQSGELANKLDALTAKRRAAFAALADKDFPALAKDPSAQSLGHAVFLGNCAGCHGADAHGAIGFPNLTDKDWLYGGDPETLVKTITEGRHGQMPAFGAVLQPDALQALVEFVPFWSDATLDAGRRERGMKQFAITCAACHGAEGKGNPLLGAPNLTDNIWLYGGTSKKVRETIVNGRGGQMPAHATLLTPEEIRIVAAYVYGLSNAPASLVTP
jgi:cytochrome c oxidase cbb3-type subunit III